MKKTLFLIFSGAILIFSMISICCAPIINGDIIKASSWKTNNCKLKEDIYNLNKDDDNKKEKNKCKRQKAMYGLEYSSLIADLILSLICTILGLLLYFDATKLLEKISGLIGLVTGIIGFFLTLIYICFSGYIFINDITKSFDDSFIYIPVGGSQFPLLKLDKDGAFAEWDDSKGQYKCIFYKENKPDSIYATYSELGKKQYNYEKKRYIDVDSKYSTCSGSYDICDGSNEYIPSDGTLSVTENECPYIYLSISPTGIENKYVFDRWISTIIFSCFIIAFCIGLAIFGFLLFKSDGSGV